MNTAITNRVTKQHAWKPFGFSLFFCLLQAGNLLATDTGRSQARRGAARVSSTVQDVDRSDGNVADERVGPDPT